jgi:membrane protein required for colicin V production
MIDIVLLIVIGGSALLGLIRGFVGTLVSTAAWLLAGWATFEFGGQAAFWLSDNGKPTITELFGGYALSFVVVMVVVVLIGAMARSMVQSAGLSGVDRLLGTALGLLRGAFLASILVLLMGFTPLPREPAWRQSQVLPMLIPAAGWMRSKLPNWSVPQIDFRNGSETGDNGGLGNLQVPALEQAVQQAIESAKGGMAPRDPAGNTASGQAVTGQAVTGHDPANIEFQGQDPANVESKGSDPANIESSRQRPNGQKRPQSQ